jgi:hypothetical protein
VATGYAIDIEKVLTACAEHDDAVEINPTHGARSGLPLARDGAPARVPDEHKSRCPFNPRNRPNPLGVEMARKGGMPKDRVLNCPDEFADSWSGGGRAAWERRLLCGGACSGRSRLRRREDRPAAATSGGRRPVEGSVLVWNQHFLSRFSA